MWKNGGKNREKVKKMWRFTWKKGDKERGKVEKNVGGYV